VRRVEPCFEQASTSPTSPKALRPLPTCPSRVSNAAAATTPPAAAPTVATGLGVQGITTDGSSLYPKVLKELWPGAPHQICAFHVIKEITKAVLAALAKLRKEMNAQIPQQRRGRPRKAQQAQTRRSQRCKQRVAELFERRHLFVRRHPTAEQKKVLARLVRGRPQLRALREIMDEVYRLFDRRCKTATAVRRLQRLRQHVRRFKRLA
jgi:Transposase